MKVRGQLVKDNLEFQVFNIAPRESSEIISLDDNQDMLLTVCYGQGYIQNIKDSTINILSKKINIQVGYYDIKLFKILNRSTEQLVVVGLKIEILKQKQGS